MNVFELVFDLATVPAGEAVDLPIELLFREARPELLETANVYVEVETGLLSCWVISPEGKQYASVDLFRYPVGKVSARERVVPAHLLDAMDGQILSFSLLSTKPDFVYECRWQYRE